MDCLLQSRASLTGKLIFYCGDEHRWTFMRQHLLSLSRLVSSMPNMVLKDEIGEQVQSSLAEAKAAQRQSLEGAYHAAAEAARKARSLAEAAFFQPSIMSLLYFPIEHDLLIYSPFFVPVFLWVCSALLEDGSRYKKELQMYRRWHLKQA